MDYKVLYRKYRPNDFSGLVGQEYITKILKNALASNKISHAYIFSGPRGTGKTSTAKIFAKAINCLHPTEDGPCNECETCKIFNQNSDIIEIDAASNNGVDEIRELINNVKLAPSYSKYKVYIIDEVHMLSQSAFNALLLTLEEPPKHVVFIFATTNIEAVPITILSRCQRFDFQKINIEEIVKRLEYIVEQEQISIDKDALEEIAYIADGGLRDALSILDQLSSGLSHITLEDVSKNFGSASTAQITNLYNTIVNNDAEGLIKAMKEFQNLALDYKNLIKKILEHLEKEAIKAKTNPNYHGLDYSNLLDMAYKLASVSNYVNVNINPYLLIEITLLNYINMNPEPTSQSTTESPTVGNYFPGNNSNPKSMPKPQTDYTELISIRINNCFVNAQKEFLQKFKAIWIDFVETLSNKQLLNLLIDTSIVAASDKVVILTHPNASSANLINDSLDELTKSYENYSHQTIYFIAVTPEKWAFEKSQYIANLKLNKKYVMIDDPSSKKIEETPKVDLTNAEETAYNIFDANLLEIE